MIYEQFSDQGIVASVDLDVFDSSNPITDADFKTLATLKLSSPKAGAGLQILSSVAFDGATAKQDHTTRVWARLVLIPNIASLVPIRDIQHAIFGTIIPFDNGIDPVEMPVFSLNAGALKQILQSDIDGMDDPGDFIIALQAIAFRSGAGAGEVVTASVQTIEANII